MNIDVYIFQYVNQFTGKNICLDATAIFFAKYLGYFLIFCLLLFLFKNFKKHWPMVVKAFGAAILARFVIVNIIRWIWERPRPFLQNQIVSLLPHEATGSFPSGHAVFYFAISTIVYFYNKKIGVLFFIGSFLIGLARVFSGVHWPSDILAGALVGVFSGWLIIKISKNF